MEQSRRCAIFDADTIHITVCNGKPVPVAILIAIADAVRDGNVYAIGHKHPDGNCADCNRLTDGHTYAGAPDRHEHSGSAYLNTSTSDPD